jgi:hypothetical protein
MFDVTDLRHQHHELFTRIQRAEFAAAEAIGARAEMVAKVNSPGKTYEMRGGWKHRCWRNGESVQGELTNSVKHALFVEEGTGLWGPKRAKYLIVPRRKKWLSWVSGGTRYFAKRVIHPGIKPKFIGHAAIYGRAAPFVGEDHSKNIATIERELQRVA